MCRFAGISLVSGRCLWRLVTAGYEAFVCSPFAVQLGKRRPGAALRTAVRQLLNEAKRTSAPIARRARTRAPRAIPVYFSGASWQVRAPAGARLDRPRARTPAAARP